MIGEQKKRNIAYKLRIGDLLNGKPVLDGERLSFLEIEDKKVIRVNVVANIIEKYEAEGEKKYISLTLDDASGQIRIKIFGDDVSKFREITQGNTVVVVGLLRFYNNEIYIYPEIIKIQDPRYLLVRKLEFEKEKQVSAITDGNTGARAQIIELIKNAEPNGVETEKIVMSLSDIQPIIINEEIQKILEDGVAYESRPGILRYLG